MTAWAARASPCRPPMRPTARALRNTTVPFSSQTMTPWGSVSRARRSRMASDARLGHRLGRLPGDLLELAEDHLDASFVGDVHSQPGGQGREPLLQAAAPGTPSQPGSDDDQEHHDYARGDVPVHIAVLHHLSVAGRSQACATPVPRDRET